MVKATGEVPGPSAVSRPSQTRSVTLLTAVALVGFGYFAACVTSMHLIRPEYDPVAETVSQYAIGPYGYLMTAGFFSVGAGVVSLADVDRSILSRVNTNADAPPTAAGRTDA